MSSLRHDAALVRQILIAWLDGASWNDISRSSGIGRSTIRDLVGRFATRSPLYPELDLRNAPANVLRDLCYAKPTVTFRDIYFAQRTPGPDGKVRSLRALAESGEFGGLGKTRISEINSPLSKPYALPAFLRAPRPAGVLEICEDRRLYRMEDGRTQRVIVAMAPASGAVAATLIFGPETEKGKRGERSGWFAGAFLTGLSRLFASFGGTPRSIEFVERVSPSLRYLLQRQGYPELDEFAKHFGVAIPKMHRPRKIEPNGRRRYRPMRDDDLAPSRGIREFLDMQLHSHIDEDALGSVGAFRDAVSSAVDAWNAQRIQPLEMPVLELYRELDWQHWKPLPDTQYSYRQIKRVLAQFDGHCVIARTRYSVPFAFWDRWLREGRGRKRSRTITAFVDGATVELLVDDVRILHRRSSGGYVTNPAHLASQNKRGNHRNPGFARRAEKIAGKVFGDVVRAVIASREYPEQGYAHALGVAKYAHEANLEILTNRKVELAALAQRKRLRGSDVIDELRSWGCVLSRDASKAFARVADREPHVGRIAGPRIRLQNR